MMMKKNLVNLPDDLLEEILSRVPLLSLLPLRSTCKRWNALIKDEGLAKKHSINAPKQSLIMLLIASRVYLASVDLHTTHNNMVKLSRPFSLKDPLSHQSSKEVNIRQIFHCDSFLLCTTEDNRLGVWNPCSSRDHIIWIQPRTSYKRFDIFALGKSSCNKYKILRMDQSNHMSPGLLEYEIYDFTSNSWRVLGKIQREFFIPLSKDRGMSVNGNTYWHASTKDHWEGYFLLSFDFSTEKFGVVSLPGDHLSYDKIFALSVTGEDEKLCMLADQTEHGKANIDVWIATKIESTGITSMFKFVSIGVAHIEKPFCFGTAMQFLVDQENKVLVCRGKHGMSNVFLHVLGEDKSIHVDHHDAESRCSLVISYVPTLVQIQQGR